MERSVFYHFIRNGQNIWIELICYSNNQYAAEKAMMNTYGFTRDMLVTTGSHARGNSYSTFDGRNYH